MNRLFNKRNLASICGGAIAVVMLTLTTGAVVMGAGMAASSAAPDVQAADRVTPVQITFTKWFNPGFPNMVASLAVTSLAVLPGRFLALPPAPTGASMTSQLSITLSPITRPIPLPRSSRAGKTSRGVRRCLTALSRKDG